MWFLFISFSTMGVWGFFLLVLVQWGEIVVIMNLWKIVEMRSCQSSEKMIQVLHSKSLESKGFFHEL